MNNWIDEKIFSRLNRRPGKQSRGATVEEALVDFYRVMLTEVSMNRFKWNELPDGIPTRFVERELFYNGVCVFFRHPTYGKFFALRGSPVGMPNVYDNPSKFQVYGNGMVQLTLGYAQNPGPLKECVPIYANYTRSPNAQIVNVYAERLARIDRTLDINTVNSRHPKIFKGSPNMRLSAANVAKQLNDGADFLMLTDEMADAVDTLDMGIDVRGFGELSTLRNRVFNECMGFLGIDNANQDKTERLVKGEIEANDDQTDVSRAISMNAREEAAAEINATYGLDISVEYIGKSSTMPEVEIGGSA